MDDTTKCIYEYNCRASRPESSTGDGEFTALREGLDDFTTEPHHQPSELFRLT
jgi:hypothetical protein